MNVDDYKKATVNWYQERLGRFEHGIAALSSGTEERRAIRFKVLSEVGIRPGCSVLDVGCGYADFFAYLSGQGCEVAYTGVDLVPELVEEACRRHPGADIQVRDLMAQPFVAASFDYAVSSQTFNLRFGEDSNALLVQQMMHAMFATAREGVAIDFTTDYVDFREPYLQYHSPEQTFGFGKTLTRRALLRHDYPLFEFCLYLYPDFKPWRQAP